METIWFAIVALMFVMYLVLDGFDLGAGMIYFYVARTEVERKIVLKAIGPVWNGNEVWLVAGGGLLFCAFPKAFAAGFSGFYLALFLILWLLMWRGLAIELRSIIDHSLWRPIWDLSFMIASLSLAIVGGIAIGDLVRGVPLDSEGYFFMPLWTTLWPSPEPGILNVHTVLNGIFGATILAVHGANYLAMKTEGELNQRACRFAKMGGWAILLLGLINGLTLSSVHPELVLSYSNQVMGYVSPILALLAFGYMLYCRYHVRDVAAFVSSCLFIIAVLGTIAWAYYPNLLLASSDSHRHLTIYNASTSAEGLQTGLAWVSIGLSLVIAYTVYIYRVFWGKVSLSPAEDN